MHLVSEWIPALDGVKQNSGARRARRGRRMPPRCVVILMAKLFRIEFFRFDYHQPSIDRAANSA